MQAQKKSVKFAKDVVNKRLNQDLIEEEEEDDEWIKRLIK